MFYKVGKLARELITNTLQLTTRLIANFPDNRTRYNETRKLETEDYQTYKYQTPRQPIPQKKKYTTPHFLEVINPEAKKHPRKRRYEIKELITTLGNSSSNQIVVRNNCISRSHLKLVEVKVKGKKRIELQIPESTNGTWKKRKGKNPENLNDTKILLNNGNVFFLGHPSNKKSVRIKYIFPSPLPIRILKIGFISTAATFACTVFLVIINWFNIPGAKLEQFSGSPVIIYASDLKTPLKPLAAKNPEPIKKISDFPDFLPQALIASEDSRFYSNIGIDPRGITRALINNIFGGSEGGSSITQQVARTIYPKWVGRERSIKRKVKEILVALKLNLYHSKDDILLSYLNSVYLGTDSNGFAQAAKNYFSKPVQDLNLAEAATLVAMLPAPNNYNPCNPNTKAINNLSERRRRVINRMEMLGYIKNPSEARKAKVISVSNILNPSACEASNRQAEIIPRIYYSQVYRELYNLMQGEIKQGNLVVETTLDINKQKEARSTLESFVKNKGKDKNISQGSLVSLDSRTGEIIALVDAVEPQKPTLVYNKKEKRNIEIFHDYAAIEELPPGSTFKIFAYVAALEKGISPNKSYSCEGFSFEGEKFDRRSFPDSHCQSDEDKLSLSTAMGVSDNLIALKVAEEAGLRRTINIAKKMGIHSNLTPKPRLILGRSRVNLLEMTGAYGVLANRGIANSPHVISRIVDISSKECNYQNYKNNNNCPVIYSYTGDFKAGLPQDLRRNKKAISADVADNITALLRTVTANSKDGMVRGTASNVKIKGAVGKTGTSDKAQDLWFIGYIPSDLVTGVWLGNPSQDRARTKGRSFYAAQIWQDYMRKIGYS